jgi:hypothetical protein
MSGAGFSGLKLPLLVLLGSLLLQVTAGSGCAQAPRGGEDSQSLQRDQPLLAIYQYGRDGVHCEAAIWPDGGMLFMFWSAPPDERGLRYTVLDAASLGAIERAVEVARAQIPPRDRTFALDVETSMSAVIWLGGAAPAFRIEWSETYQPSYLRSVESIDEFAAFASAWARIRLLVAWTVAWAEQDEAFSVFRPGRDYWAREGAWRESHTVR